MKMTTLSVMLLALLVATSASCMTINDAKLLMHEGVVKSYQLDSLDSRDLIVFTDNTSYLYAGILVWDGCEAIRSQCAVQIGQSYKIYYLDENVAYLVQSNQLYTPQTNCGCK